ncbi:MAG: carbonic anhydrase [Methylophilaceae bacterium]|nr:carbonic anhydrase [Methylophilaceae bacterium]
MYKHPLDNREKMTPKEALDILIEGNHRFVNDLVEPVNHRNLASITKNEQRPFAGVLSCSDSRAPTELIFDQALGSIFSVRLAGNIASNKAIGSLEFACKHLGSKLVVVLGHTGCGAVKAACDNFEEGHIGEITSLIKPAVNLEHTVTELRNSKNIDFLAKVCKLNVDMQIRRMLSESVILTELLDQKKIGLVGGIYDLDTAQVSFIADDMVF